jgi:hypothetical protein
MLNVHVQVRALITEANEWIGTATFADASDEQVLELVNVFEPACRSTTL